MKFISSKGLRETHTIGQVRRRDSLNLVEENMDHMHISSRKQSPPLLSRDEVEVTIRKALHKAKKPLGNHYSKLQSFCICRHYPEFVAAVWNDLNIMN